MKIHGCELEMTSSVCPEQYDVLLDGRQIGYLRLRHGIFRADYPICGGETVYIDYPNGDGEFDAEERDEHLKKAVSALLQRHATGAAP